MYSVQLTKHRDDIHDIRQTRTDRIGLDIEFYTIIYDLASHSMPNGPMMRQVRCSLQANRLRLCRMSAANNIQV